MPAKPSYSHRLVDGIAALETVQTDWIERRQVEEALGVSKTVAWRILRKCGAEQGPGQTRICRRVDLIARLKELQRDGAIHEHEIRRRDRLHEFLENIRPSVIANLTEVVAHHQAATLRDTTFPQLPSNVTFTRRTLHIEFDGADEFLQAFGAVVYALNNDFTAIRAFLEQD